MGYSTTFKGELKFTNDLTSDQISLVSSFLGQDCRDHPEWGDDSLTYIDLEFTKDGKGLKWDGSEKTYDLTDKVNLIIRNVQKKYPEFGLTGSLIAQGEDIEDRWSLTMESNVAIKKETAIAGKTILCPHCGEHFILEIES